MVSDTVALQCTVYTVIPSSGLERTQGIILDVVESLYMLSFFAIGHKNLRHSLKPRYCIACPNHPSRSLERRVKAEQAARMKAKLRKNALRRTFFFSSPFLFLKAVLHLKNLRGGLTWNRRNPWGCGFDPRWLHRVFIFFLYSPSFLGNSRSRNIFRLFFSDKSSHFYSDYGPAVDFHSDFGPAVHFY